MSSLLQTRTRTNIVPALAVLLGLVMCYLVYLPGLHGPLLLDDQANLAEVNAFLEGEKTARAVIFDNRSGPLGRPVAMATFVLDASLWGESVWYFKHTNLVIHLVTGLMVYLLASLLLRTTHQDSSAAWRAALIAIIWLALPIHASTVLYLVQRMAQLSALFMVAGLCAYVGGRVLLERGRYSGLLLIWAGVPVLTVLAALSKENGLLVPALAAAIELFWFRRGNWFQPPASRGRRWIDGFFVAFLLMPGLLAVIWLLSNPDRLTGGYLLRDFSLWERLLTQPRVLWDYVSSILLPNGPRLGIFHDHFPVSHNLWSPLTTLPALLAWLGVIVAVWLLRRKSPLFAGGMALFLVGHVMESSIWPLEIYFEHRNYLPSIGLLLAVVGIVECVASRMSVPTAGFRVTGLSLLVVLPLVYLGTTYGRAFVWSDSRMFYSSQYEVYPESVRLNSYLLGFAMNAGDLDGALDHIEQMDTSRPGGEKRMAPTLWRFLAYCAVDQSPPDDLYTQFESRASGKIFTYDMVAWQELSEAIEAGDCPGLDVARLVALSGRWLERTSLPDSMHQVWRTRYYRARLLAALARYERSRKEGEKAWVDSAYNRGIGVFVFQINATLENWARCAEVLRRLERSEGAGDLRFDQAVETFRNALQDKNLESPVGVDLES
ncbi:MAG: hypothetical protein HND55_05880 [Pseudomonadota bacterium]|nr:MAG: hypothetical protein HND55_05880 [Pseudomonadota bacterium]